MSEFLDRIAEPGLRALAGWSLRWALPIAALAALLAVRRPRRAATRHLLAVLVLWAGLLLPIVPRWGPGLWRPAAPAPAAVMPAAPAVAAAVAPRVERPAGPASPSPGENEAAPAGRPPAAVEPMGARRLVVLGLAAAYAAGVVARLGRLVVGRRLVGRLLREAGPVGAGSARLLAACAAEVGLRRRVGLAAHPALGAPAAIGGRAPMVIVPADWDGRPEAVRRACLLHELAHLARRDDRSKWGLELVRAGFFFHPMVRWLIARVERERESLCDEAAVARGVDPRAYARMLLEFARRPGGLLGPAVACHPEALPFLARGTVRSRIEHLLEADMERWLSPLPARRALALSAAVLGTALGLGSARFDAVATAAAPPSPLPLATASAAPGRSHMVEVRGTIVDDETGAPIGHFVTQGGRPDPADPSRVSWGWGVTAGSGPASNQLRTALRWNEGEKGWLRVFADGYLPQPITEGPLSEREGVLDIVVRMRRGRTLRGRVVDHAGRAAAGATVALVNGLAFGIEDGAVGNAGAPGLAHGVTRTTTDADGRFALTGHGPESRAVAVSAPSCHFWTADVPKDDREMAIALPEAGRIVVRYDIEGDDPEAEFWLQNTAPAPVNNVKRRPKVANAGRLVIEGVEPGTHAFWRHKDLRVGDVGIGAALEGRELKVAPGQSIAIDLVRDRGAPIVGRVVGLEARKVVGAFVSVEQPEADRPKDRSPLTSGAIDARTTDPDGRFRTARIPPGRHLVLVQLFEPPPAGNPFGGGLRGPSYRMSIGATVPEQGAPEELTIEIPPPRPAADGAAPALKVHGKVVDAETGKPISKYVVQDGRPDPKDPKHLIWGWSEGRIESANPEGLLRETLGEKGSWRRILAAGYLPEPITEKPFDGREGDVEVTVKLRRGRQIVGRVLDPAGKPVPGASVFLVGGRSAANITGGIAIRSFAGGEDKTVTKTTTDADGRFTLDGAGADATTVAVSAPKLDLWLVPAPAEGQELPITLPEPGTLVIRHEIAGAGPEATVFMQFLRDERKGWEAAESIRELKVANPGRLVLDNLTPGTYDVARFQKNLRVGDIGLNPFCDRQNVVVEAGKTAEVAFIRAAGVPIEGEVVGLKALKVPGTFVLVNLGDEAKDGRPGRFAEKHVEALATDESGRFRTPRLLPGTYTVVAEAYAPETPEQRLRTGWRTATYRAFAVVTVPAEGPAPPVRIEMPKP